MSGILQLEVNPETGFGYVAAANYGVGYDDAVASLVTNETLQFLRTIGIINRVPRIVINHIFCADGSRLENAPKPLIALVSHDPVLVQSEHIIWKNLNMLTHTELNIVMPRGQIILELLAKIGLSTINKPELNLALPMSSPGVYRA